MTVSFNSSKYVVERAKHHIDNLKRQIIAFNATDPYSQVVEVDVKTSEDVHKIKLTKPMPVALKGIAFDAVSNLRSALDQAIFEVTEPSQRKGRFAHFPFARSVADLEIVMKGRCKGVPTEIADLIRGFQPYKGGNNLLWALNEIGNTNKHAFICPVALFSGRIHYHRVLVSGNLSTPPPIWDRTKNEMEVLRVGLGSTVEADFSFTSCIAIRDIQFVDGQPVDTVLEQFTRIVEGIVVAIEAEAHRIGF